MKTIKEWQKAAYDLAVKKGWHSQECTTCKPKINCPACGNTRKVLIDPEAPARIASRLALIHCEISEAAWLRSSTHTTKRARCGTAARSCDS